MLKSSGRGERGLCLDFWKYGGGVGLTPFSGSGGVLALLGDIRGFGVVSDGLRGCGFGGVSSGVVFDGIAGEGEQGEMEDAASIMLASTSPVF